MSSSRWADAPTDQNSNKNLAMARSRTGNEYKYDHTSCLALVFDAPHCWVSKKEEEQWMSRSNNMEHRSMSCLGVGHFNSCHHTPMCGHVFQPPRMLTAAKVWQTCAPGMGINIRRFLPDCITSSLFLGCHSKFDEKARDVLSKSRSRTAQVGVFKRVYRLCIQPVKY